MTARHETKAAAPPIRRSPWIAIVDAALPVVLVFWTLVDRSSSVMASLAHSRLSSSGTASQLH